MFESAPAHLKRRSRVPAWSALVAAVLMAPATMAGGASAQNTAETDLCAITTSARIVAIGDVHGAFDNFRRILRDTGLTNASDRWIGGSAHLVQLGDVLDRGADSRKVVDLLRRLEQEAPRSGGRVHALLGNHEAMRIMRDLRYVSPGEYAAFRSPDADALREQFYTLARDAAEARARKAGDRFNERAFRAAFLKDVLPGYVEMQVAFEADGDYGRWVRQRPAMVRINNVLFVHGGISPKIAPLGCAGVNAGVRRELGDLPALDDPTTAETLIAGSDGPLWYRGLAEDASTMTEGQVAELLRAFGATFVVVGHTVSPTLVPRSRFGNRVVQVDTGMLGAPNYPGGRPTALEILDGQVTAIVNGRRVPLCTQPAAVPAR